LEIGTELGPLVCDPLLERGCWQCRGTWIHGG